MLKDSNLRIIGFVTFIVLAIVWASAFSEARYYFFSLENRTIADLGQFGDSFGWINSVLSFFAILFASAAFFLQAVQHKKEVERSQLEDNKKSWAARPCFSSYCIDNTSFFNSDLHNGTFKCTVSIVNNGTKIRNVRADYLGLSMWPDQESQSLQVMEKDEPETRLTFHTISPKTQHDTSVFVIVPLVYETEASERFDVLLKIVIQCLCLNSQKKCLCPIELMHCRQIPFEDPKKPIINNDAHFRANHEPYLT